MIYSSEHTVGFSLIELLVVLAITSILLSLVLPNSVNWVSRANYQAEEKELQALIENAKFRAFAEAKALHLEVRPDRVLGPKENVLIRLESITCEATKVSFYPHGAMKPNKVVCKRKSE